jgi:hypothetical protein
MPIHYSTGRAPLTVLWKTGSLRMVYITFYPCLFFLPSAVPSPLVVRCSLARYYVCILIVVYLPRLLPALRTACLLHTAPAIACGGRERVPIHHYYRCPSAMYSIIDAGTVSEGLARVGLDAVACHYPVYYYAHPLQRLPDLLFFLLPTGGRL